MEKFSAVAVAVALLAGIGSVVNVVRGGGAADRLKALEDQLGTPARMEPAAGASASSAVTAQELAQLKTEISALKTEIEKVRAEKSASGNGSGTGTNGTHNPSAGSLTPSDVVRIMDEELHNRWRQNKLREVEHTVKRIEEHADQRLTKWKKLLVLSDQQATQVGGILKDQVDALRTILSDIEADAASRQERINKVIADGDARMKALLDATQLHKYEKDAAVWPGLNQDRDPVKPEGTGPDRGPK